jgi:hypothetical protein
MSHAVGRDRTHSQTVFSHPPRCHRACDFHRTRRPPIRTFTLIFLLPPNRDSPVYRGRAVLKAPDKLWPFAMCAAFPRSNYYGHADFPQPHPRFSEVVSNPLLPLSFASAEGSPMFPLIDSTRSLRWRLSRPNLSPHIAAPQWVRGKSGEPVPSLLQLKHQRLHRSGR